MRRFNSAFPKIRRLGLALSLLLFLEACSSTTFVYNRLDFILPWYMDDYVDLSRAQKASLDELLNPFLNWHRLDELPRYIEILNGIEQSLDGAVTPETVGYTFSEIEGAWLRLEDRALDWLLELGEQLSDEQIRAFLAVLQEQQGEYEEEYLERSDEEYLQDSYDNFEDGLNDYLGRLDKSQQATLRQASADLMRMDTLWLQERAAWLLKMGTSLERASGWQQKLREQRATREEHYSPQYREMYAHNLEVIQIAVARVMDSRSDKQDRRLRKKLKNLKEDFETLVDQGASE